MEYLDVLLPHWPFAAASAVFFSFVKVMKDGPLSASRAQQYRWVRFIRQWFPLPFHPIVAGALLGLVPGVPVSPGVEAWTLGPMLYFAGAGTVPIVGRDVYQEWKKYHGLT